MYCSGCGNPLSPGLSFCNRCGTSLKERSHNKNNAIAAYLTAITLIGISGLGLMFAGALVLRQAAALHDALVGFFMLFTFLIVLTTEILLVKQLSRLTEQSRQVFIPSSNITQNELPQAQPRALGEPAPSVTESTTRTLEYQRLNR
jgi:predicted nucleic acid-binding Zn ribbon protein